MTFDDIATVTGKGGLFRIISVTRGGLVLESLDEQKTKLITSANNKVSVLSEVSVYTTRHDKMIPLQEVLQKIKSEFGDDPGVDEQSDSKELRSFLKSVVPDHDENKVYISDIKKMIRWYAQLLKNAPQLLEPEKAEATKGEEKADEKESPEA